MTIVLALTIVAGVGVRNRRNNAADRKTFQGGNHLHEIR